MPLDPNYESLSRVDKLYENKNQNKYNTYEELRVDIASINQSILNNHVNVVFDSVYDSHSTIKREELNLKDADGKFLKKRVYGIVVGNSIEIGSNVYVDVPLQNTNTVTGDDIFLSNISRMEDFQELIFFPNVGTLQATPQIGTLAVVLIPSNFPNHSITNPEDAIFIDIYRKEILSPLNINRPPIKAVPDSELDLLLRKKINSSQTTSQTQSKEESSSSEQTPSGTSSDGSGDLSSKKPTDFDITKNNKVLLVGDSHSAVESKNYGYNLEKLMKESGYQVYRVAKGGISADGYLSPNNMDMGFYSRKKPRIVVGDWNQAMSMKFDIAIITLGTNDGGNHSDYRSNDGGKTLLKTPNNRHRGMDKRINDIVTLKRKIMQTTGARIVIWVGPARSKGQFLKETNPLWRGLEYTHDMRTKDFWDFASKRPELQGSSINSLEFTGMPGSDGLHFVSPVDREWAEYVFKKVQAYLKN